MSSPCTVPRLVRWRVRDLASCFYACRFPLEEEPDVFCSKPLQMSNKSMVFDSKGSSGGHKATRKMSIIKKMCSEDGGESVESSSKNSRKGGRAAESGSQAEPHFAEEDYIVFCFREDGGIHMINEGKSSEAYDENDEHVNTTTTTSFDAAAAAAPPPTLRPINRKLHYVEHVGYTWDSRRGGTINPNDKYIQISEDEILISDMKGDEKGSKEMEPEQPNVSRMNSSESSDSNPSDTSTSSFAFPALGVEWIGSPVHMPKSENQDAQSVRLHCCRF